MSAQRVAVLAGGRSSEHEVSLASGASVADGLRTAGHAVTEINTGRDEYMNAIGPRLTAEALEAGIYLRPLGNTVYFMPPYCITPKEMDQVYDFLVHCVKSYLPEMAR